MLTMTATPTRTAWQAEHAITERMIALVEDVTWMLDTGCTDAGMIARRAGVTQPTLLRYLYGMQRQDLLARMTNREKARKHH